MLESIQGLSPGLYSAHQKGAYPNFRQHLLSHSTLQCWCGPEP